MPESSHGLVQQFVERTGQLYSLPAVAMEVLRLTSEPKLDARALKDCLERDPRSPRGCSRSSTARSSASAGPSATSTQALALLGTRPLKMLVLGFSLPKELFTGLSAERAGPLLAAHARSKPSPPASWPTSSSARPATKPSPPAWCRTSACWPSSSSLASPTCGWSIIARRTAATCSNASWRRWASTTRSSVPACSTAGACRRRCARPSPCPTTSGGSCSLAPDQRTLPQILHLADLLARLVEQPFGPALHELLHAGHAYCGADLRAAPAASWPACRTRSPIWPKCWRWSCQRASAIPICSSRPRPGWPT